MSWMSARSRFKYVTNNDELNRALNILDNELAELKSRSEEHITYAEFEELERRVERIERFLRKMFLEEWEAFEE